MQNVIKVANFVKGQNVIYFEWGGVLIRYLFCVRDRVSAALILAGYSGF